MFYVVAVSVAIGLLGVGFGLLMWITREPRGDVKKKEKDLNQRMYELAILKALGERIGYSLNIQNIADVITGSLHQFIEYSLTSYMLIEPEKILFKVHIEESVSRKFIDNVRDRMLKSLSALLDKDFSKIAVEEVLTGAILVEDVEQPVQSFFNIPLIIGDKVVGVITVAHTKAGLYKEDEMTILYKITKQASTAVTKLEEVVETEQRKLNAMVESMSEGVVMTDKDYRIVVVNPPAKRVIGQESKEDLTIFDFIDNLEGKFDIRGKLEESVKLSKVLIVEDVLIHDRFYKIIVSPVKSSLSMATDKEVIGGVTIFHDITHEKEIERLREDFTAMMVHELRSPLSGIRMAAQVLQKETSKKSGVTTIDADTVDTMFDSSSRMLGLVNDLLDVAKLESGKFELDKSVSSVKEVIADSLKLMEPVAKKNKIKLDLIFGPDIPTGVNLDPQRITQVITNLLSNAIKFSDTDSSIYVQVLHKTLDGDTLVLAREAGIKWFVGKKNTITIPNCESLIVAVTDSGIGMGKADMLQLFNKFKQLKATAINEQKGTGLGLSIVKSIVEAHGGVTGVASEKGSGSTFYFTIPICG
jgi:PAS domain S-box-containing protein